MIVLSTANERAEKKITEYELGGELQRRVNVVFRGDATAVSMQLVRGLKPRATIAW